MIQNQIQKTNLQQIALIQIQLLVQQHLQVTKIQRQIMKQQVIAILTTPQLQVHKMLLLLHKKVQNMAMVLVYLKQVKALQQRLVLV